jgi:hypothetical protein
MAEGKRRATPDKTTTPLTTTLAPRRSTRASRAAERERRRQQRRTRTTVAIAAGVALLVGVVAVLVGGAVRGEKKPAGPKVRTQRTLLLQVTGDDRSTRAAALLAYDPGPRRASLVLLPPNTLIDVAGLGNIVVRNAVRLGGTTTAREAVSDLLGVTVDHDWTLTAKGFVALVDKVGGVTVEVDTDVVVPGPGGADRILLRPGAGQRLDGATALTYATYVGPGQDQIASQVRFQAVLDALFDALPAEPEVAAAAIGSVGREGTLSWRPEELVTFVHGIRDAHAEDRYDPQVLPVTAIDTGGAEPTFSIKVDEVNALVRAQLADSIPPGRDDGTNRILVLNGVGTPGLGGSIAQRLRSTTYRVVGTRNKQGFGVRQSVVVVFDSSEPSLEKARDVARLLGLSPEAVRIGTQNQSVADVIVVIGADYKP